MIETDAQYRDAKIQVKGLEDYFASFQGNSLPPDAPQKMKDPRWRAIYEESTRGMLEDLKLDLAIFEARRPRENFAVSAMREPERV